MSEAPKQWERLFEQAEFKLLSFDPDGLAAAVAALELEIDTQIHAVGVDAARLTAIKTRTETFFERCAFYKAHLSRALTEAALPEKTQRLYTRRQKEEMQSQSLVKREA